MRKDLALFDFDGTITRKDTFLEFIKFHRGQTAFYLGFTLLSPVMLLFKLGILANWQAKEAAIRYFFSGENVEKLDKSGREFCDKVMPKIVRKAALTAIHEHQGKG
ncbi:MAG: haloacid dehalogenase-like hydrolase, partial [Fulvivirga sp.]|nr:haloacid dehalogenase-like hydrolase [Fulvivirga sp.]